MIDGIDATSSEFEVELDDAGSEGKSRLSRVVGLVTGGSIVVRTFGLVTGIVLARVLGPADRGRLALVVLVAGLAGSLGSMGLNAWLARRVAQEGLGVAEARVIRLHLLLTLGVAGLVASIGLAVRSVEPEMLLLAVALSWLTLASLVALGAVQGLQRLRALAMADVAGTGVYMVLVLVAATSDSMTLTLALAATAVGRLVMFVWALWPLVRERTTTKTDPGPRRNYYPVALRFGAPVAIGAALTVLVYRFDLAIVAVYLDAEAVGLYAVALSVAELFWLVPTATNTAILPRIAVSEDAVDTPVIVRITTLGLLLATAVFAAVGPWLIPAVFGTEYAGAYGPLVILAVGAIFASAWKLLVTDLLARGESQHRAVSALMALTVMVLADAVLIPTLELIGAALGSLLSYATACAYVAWRWGRRTGRGVVPLLGVRADDLRQLLDVVRRGAPRRGVALPQEERD